jgi:tripartite ATP-independent transporter DctM subunit
MEIISPAMLGIFGLVFMLILMFAGVPIGFVFGFVGLIGLALMIGIKPAISLLGTIAYNQVANYTWTVLPLFMLMGQIAGDAGLTGDAYNTARKWIGKTRGGLCYATIGGSTMFAAVSGSQLASSVTMTKIAWPEMKRYGYAPSISLGSIICAGTLANLIPPSIPMVIYGMIAEESIGSLFIAGLLPGLLTAVLMMISMYVVCIFKPSLAPEGPPSNWLEKLKALKKVWPILMLMIFIMGSIWGGICTPTEAAGVGVMGTVIIGIAKKGLSWKILWDALGEVVILSGSIFILFITLQVFNSFMTVTQLPQSLAGWIIGMDVSPRMILVIILFIYLILGIPLDLPPLLILTLPIFLPVLKGLGIDILWFGVLSTIAVGLSFITPPVGGPMFVIHGLVRDEGVSLTSIFMGCTIFCIPVTLALVLCIIFPGLSTWLPGIM